MAGQLLLQALVLSILGQCFADIYMHNPRGSNNRLNEKSAQRQNGNRVFDSQNNNRGGYNVGDKTDKAARSEADQYNMQYFTSSASSRTSKAGRSTLKIEWTNQHGCGGNEDTDPHKLNCNMVIQFLCQRDADFAANDKRKLRNGFRTSNTEFQGGQRNERRQNTLNRMNNNLKTDRVLQDSWMNYDKCNTRERNKGLFTADQNVRGNEAKHTRQNPNGNRRGYECPEERDYYPYWHPSEWKDIAVLAENASRCDFYKKESYNVKGRHECVQKDSSNQVRISSLYNNEKACTENNGVWTEFTNYLEKAPKSLNTEAKCKAASKAGIKYVWGIPMFGTQKECLVALEAPDCREGDWSRVNHLGNGRTGQPLSYEWTLPHFPSGDKHRCVLRLRYNISTDDYDPVRTDSSRNADRRKGIVSPVQNNPQVNIGASNQPLRLAINTAQFGRTFQDRSHLFMLESRPAGLESQTIHNLNVRGKRGNIVQTYPAVEYDFYPTDLKIKRGELVHAQWTGSNTHNNQNPGGDGQTGDAGEGTGGTDRSNIVEVKDRNNNYPLPFENTNMFKNAKIHWKSDSVSTSKLTGEDIAVRFASAGYYQCVKSSVCGRESVESKTEMQNQLNNAPASYVGMLMEFKAGKYHYICSRNNNFTNRSQKGTIEVL